MYSYFDNQPFLHSLSSQTSVINRLEKKNQYLTIALCAVAAGLGIALIKIRQDQTRVKNNPKNGGYRLY